MTKQQKEQFLADLDKIIKKGKLIESFEKTEVYKLILDWIEKESNIDKIYSSLGEKRIEAIGYTRFGLALIKQFEIWKKIGSKKQIESNKLIEENEDKKNIN